MRESFLDVFAHAIKMFRIENTTRKRKTIEKNKSLISLVRINVLYYQMEVRGGEREKVECGCII